MFVGTNGTDTKSNPQTKSEDKLRKPNITKRPSIKDTFTTNSVSFKTSAKRDQNGNLTSTAQRGVNMARSHGNTSGAKAHSALIIKDHTRRYRTRRAAFGI